MVGTSLTVGHFINGRSVEPDRAGETTQVYKPASGAVIAEAPIGTATEVDEAVRGARDAFADWSRYAPSENERVLHAIAQAIEDLAERLAEVESDNTGKRLDVARDEVLGAAEVFRFYAGYPTKDHGAHIPTADRSMLCYTIAEPLGVIGAIAPWNYPLLIAAGKVGAALAAGCSVVIKPAPETPLTTVELGRIGHEAGLPPGTLNVVTGDGSTGAAVAGHPGISKVTFTGSTATGRKVLLAAGSNTRPAIMELGGKSPNVVFADIDLAASMEFILMGALTNAGQECCAGARILIEDAIFDEFVSLASERIQTLRAGVDEDAEVGPLITSRQRERVAGFVDRAKGEGARVAAVGEVPDQGFYYPPTLLTDVRAEMEACRDEIFGPVLTVDRFDGDEEALAKANDTNYGLAAGIWTSSIERAIRFARELDAGQVWINSYLSGDAAAPFGGNKESGFGRELGLEGPREFSQMKSVYVKPAPAPQED